MFRQSTDRLRRVPAADAQAFAREIRPIQHVGQRPRLAQAENVRPPSAGFQSGRQCDQRALGATDIEVGDYQCDGNRSVGPWT